LKTVETIKNKSMNNFDLILTKVKECCKEPGVPNHECFLTIEHELASIGHAEELDFHLSFLQDIGVLTYKYDEQLVALTERGKHVKALFEKHAISC